MFEVDVAAAVHLPETCHARFNAEPPLVRAYVDALDIPDRQGSRTHQTHVPFEDVKELGQFIDAATPVFAVVACLIRMDSPGPVFFAENGLD
jgi:hypothetical protein